MVRSIFSTFPFSLQNVGLALRELLSKVDAVLQELPQQTHHEVCVCAEREEGEGEGGEGRGWEREGRGRERGGEGRGRERRGRERRGMERGGEGRGSHRKEGLSEFHSILRNIQLNIQGGAILLCVW